MRFYKYSQYEMPSCTITPPEGQCFAGWAIKTVDDKVLMPGDIYSVEADTVFYPLWKPLDYTVAFNANGGTGEMPEKTLKPNDEFTLPKCDYTPKDGDVFEGWKISDSEDETVYQPGDTVIVKDNIEFIVLWKEPSVMILLGDVNDDSTVDTLDAALLAKFVNGWDDVTINVKAADINQDGTISAVDAMILTRYVNGWDGYDTYIVEIEDKDV